MALTKISTSGSETGATAAAKINAIMDAVDAIDLILQSDDATLDELQEVVNFIKTNKSDLESLDLSNIAETATLKHFTATLLTKLNGIAEGANNYVLPSTVLHTDTPKTVTAMIKRATKVANDCTYNSSGNAGKFKSTLTAAQMITFPTLVNDEEGTIHLDNSGGFPVSLDTMIKAPADLETYLGTAGIYKLTWDCDGTHVFLSVSEAFV